MVCLRNSRRQSIIHVVKVRDVLRLMTDDGWVLVRTRGSHRQFKHVANEHVITVSGKPNSDMSPGQLASIRRKTGMALR